MSTASSKQLPAHSVSIEIYSGIARYPFDYKVLVRIFSCCEILADVWLCTTG